MTILLNHGNTVMFIDGNDRDSTRVVNIFASESVLTVVHGERVALDIPNGPGIGGFLTVDADSSVSVGEIIVTHAVEVSKSSRACSRAEVESAWPASIRASSDTLSSPVSSVTSEVVNPASTLGALLTRRCLLAYAATCGKCVTTITCTRCARRANRLPICTAASPPTPASISSKMKVGTGSVSAKTTSKANMIRESSPPEAPLPSGLGSEPG